MVAPVLLVLAAGGAPFEGVLEYQLRVRNSEGTVKTYVSKLGVRSEATLPFGASKSETTVLVKADAPGTSLVWDAAKKEFVAQPPQPPQRKVTRVEPLGTATVLGLQCARVRLHDDQQGYTDYCVAKGALNDPKSDALVTKAQRLDADAVAGLASAGASGLVVKMMHATKGEPDLWLELTSLKKASVDPKLMR
jgi:hypothetical protein